MKIPMDVPGSFPDAQLQQIKLALKATPAQRLQDLQDMLDFNARAEVLNPHLRDIVEKLSRQEPRLHGNSKK